MTRTLTITYDKSNEDVPVMCVTESNLFAITVLKIFTGEKAEQLYEELIGQKMIISEQKKGHLLYDERHNIRIYVCSECGHIAHISDYYCSNCGVEFESEEQG